MLHLRQIIQKISEKDSDEFRFWLEENDAEKFAQLFRLLREGKLSEPAIANELDTNPSAFYALKSRLNGKIQTFLAHRVPDHSIDLLRNVANIPNLLYNTPREIAITQLLKLEKELIEHDMPGAITSVYSALKKLHRYSQKYFHYAQLYNKHVAYTMAIGKAKELLSDFNKLLGEYCMSCDKQLVEVLGMVREEMHNYSNLYTSHHLCVYKNILDIEFALFVAHRKDVEGKPIDEILLNTEKIIRSYKNDLHYSFLIYIVNFLWFEYFQRQELGKKSEEYFLLTNNNLSIFLLNNFCCFPSIFLLSKIRQALENNEEQKLHEEARSLAESFSPDKDDAPNYINYVKYQSASAFCSGKYSEAVLLLNNLLNDISFRNFFHAELEVKLFLALCYLLNRKAELADALIKNVQRKLRDAESEAFPNAQSFAKMLSVAMDPSDKKGAEKCQKLLEKFQSENSGSAKMLDYLRIDAALLKSISKAM